MISLPELSMTATEDRCLSERPCQYTLLACMTALLLLSVIRTITTYRKVGAFLYCV